MRLLVEQRIKEEIAYYNESVSWMDVCMKEVPDFSTMTDKEILKFYRTIVSQNSQPMG